jgi:hypothetical protein
LTPSILVAPTGSRKHRNMASSVLPCMHACMHVEAVGMGKGRVMAVVLRSGSSHLHQAVRAGAAGEGQRHLVLVPNLAAGHAARGCVGGLPAWHSNGHPPWHLEAGNVW